MFKKINLILTIVVILAILFFKVFIVGGYRKTQNKSKFILIVLQIYVINHNKFHITEFKEWKQSHHLMSMLPTNDSTVSKDFSDTIFTFDGVSSRFIKDNKFYPRYY
jgi:hypothetical protein